MKKVKLLSGFLIFSIGFFMCPVEQAEAKQMRSTHVCFDTFVKGTLQWNFNCSGCVPVKVDQVIDQNTCSTGINQQ